MYIQLAIRWKWYFIDSVMMIFKYSISNSWKMWLLKRTLEMNGSVFADNQHRSWMSCCYICLEWYLVIYKNSKWKGKKPSKRIGKWLISLKKKLSVRIGTTYVAKATWNDHLKWICIHSLLIFPPGNSIFRFK